MNQIAIIDSLTHEEKHLLRLLADGAVFHEDTIPARVLIAKGLARSAWSEANISWMLCRTELGRKVDAEIEVQI
jgi:hypothetical protein